MKKNLLIVLGLFCLMFAFSSCETNVSIDSLYSCGISNWKSPSLTDLATVENYIKDKNVPFGSVIIKAGKSVAANDAVMKSRYDAAIASIDFSTLKLDSGTQFSYTVVGLPSGSESTRTIGSYSWPK